ncbi:MAG: hypothetical protein OEZ59_06520 [Deltaproteobacteria bacterium]|nr:hypothetical protein [Deltaproteobacteria bacterium]
MGAVAPDLLGMFSRRIKPLQLENRLNGRGFHPEELLQGLRHHHQVDSRFHAGLLFQSGARNLRERLQEASDTPGLKRFFPAHLLSEMFLDKQLLREWDGLSAELDRTLVEHGESLAGLAGLHPGLDRGEFRSFLWRVAEDRYWEDYKRPRGVFERMNRILTRFGMRHLEKREEQAAMEWFEQTQTERWQELEAFVKEMQSATKD